jgi:hypothetical protein
MAGIVGLFLYPQHSGSFAELFVSLTTKVEAVFLGCNGVMFRHGVG